MGDLTDADLSYLAGIIDGGGCISLHGRGREGRGYCTPALQVANTDRRLTDWLCARLGGRVYERTDARPTRKPVFHWAIFGVQAREIIRAVEPLLLLKGEQARLVLSVQTHRGRNRMDEHERQRRIEAIAQMRELNRRGV